MENEENSLVSRFYRSSSPKRSLLKDDVLSVDYFTAILIEPRPRDVTSSHVPVRDDNSKLNQQKDEEKLWNFVVFYIVGNVFWAG